MRSLSCSISRSTPRRVIDNERPEAEPNRNSVPCGLAQVSCTRNNWPSCNRSNQLPTVSEDASRNAISALMSDQSRCIGCVFWNAGWVLSGSESS